MQVAFDILARDNAVLVAYQGDAASPSPRLHVWNGVEWLQISMDEYNSLSFLRTSPSQIVLVGDDTVLPGVLVDSVMTTQQSRVMQIPYQDTANVINSLGQILRFGKSEWNWYAARYRLDLEDMNASVRERSWYDQPNTFSDNRKTSPWVNTGPTPETPAPMAESIGIPPATSDYAPVMEPIPEASEIPPAAEISSGWGTSATDAPIK
jgi:hypothetical protein